MSIFGIEVPSKQVQAIIKATFPAYRKRKVYVKATESVCFYCHPHNMPKFIATKDSGLTMSHFA